MHPFFLHAPVHKATREGKGETFRFSMAQRSLVVSSFTAWARKRQKRGEKKIKHAQEGTGRQSRQLQLPVCPPCRKFLFILVTASAALLPLSSIRICNHARLEPYPLSLLSLSFSRVQGRPSSTVGTTSDRATTIHSSTYREIYRWKGKKTKLCKETL